MQGPLLIADGHHRYEAALRFHEEDGTDAAHVLAVLVSIADEGLEIFPTHRMTSGAVPELDGASGRRPSEDPARPRRPRGREPRPSRLRAPPFRRAALVEGGEQALDTALVDSLPLSGVEYTASAAEAEQAVASGRATAAFIVRPPTVQQVEEFARAGVRMPPKSTYFFPKLTSGLLSPLRRMSADDWLEVCREAARAVGHARGAADAARAGAAVGDGEGETRQRPWTPRRRPRWSRFSRPFLSASFGLGGARGSDSLGDGGDGVTVVCDPIDGSLNAKRGIPFFSLSLAVASGPRMDDVELGFVHDFGSGEWVARSGGGAFLNGVPLDGPGPKERVEILSLEATRTDLVADYAPGLIGFAHRTRVMGSLWRSRSATSPPGAWTRRLPQSPRGAWTSPPRSSSSASAAAVDLPRRRRSVPPRSTSAHARGSPAGTPDLCAELYARLDPT